MNTRTPIAWLSAEDQARIFVARWKGMSLTPDVLIHEFERATGIRLTVEEASGYLVQPAARPGRNGVKQG